MSHSHLDTLNDQQKEAVVHTDGPLLVLAGAGSGKTRVITHRIVHLILNGVAPHHILAVTFTNKAATEMRERVRNLINEHAGAARAGFDSLPLVTTFHSLGVRLLREHHAALNLKKHFTIYDRSDSVKVIKKSLEAKGYSPKQFEPRTILSTISRAKGDAMSRTDFLDSASSYPQRVAAEVWEEYDRIVHEDGALDFDDLLLKTMNLLKANPVIKETLQQRWQYIHVDEYQDTNKVQFEIVRLLTGEQKNICAVGDIDQNIYSWRGANIENVMKFEKQFPGAHSVFLEENYRSTQTIIAASNDIIEKNQNRIPKKVFTNNHEGEKISLYAAMSGSHEAEHVVMTIKSLLADGARPADVAVLYRTNFQSRALEEAFVNYEVPYQLLGTKFFERKEIKDVLSFLRLALNRESTADLSRIVNVPARGIGKVTLLKLLENKRDELKGATLQKVERFEEIMQDIRDQVRTEPISKTMLFILKRTGLETEFKKGGTEEDLSRLENVRELVSIATRYDELNPEEGAMALLENAALQSDQDELEKKEERDAVRLMTVHAAKGLEFPYVFITGLEEGLFPHERLDSKGVDHEEERRLFYVALTRAQKKVFLTYAHMRTIFGSQHVNVPSSFLKDISDDYIETEDVGGDTSSGFERTIYLD